jgi:hypothetical protein
MQNDAAECIDSGTFLTRRIPFRSRRSGADIRHELAWTTEAGTLARYMKGSVRSLAHDGFSSVIVDCVGTQPIRGGCCGHQKRFVLTELPDETWEDLCPWLHCTDCGNARYVNLAIDWGKKLDFTTRTGDKPSRFEDDQ